MDVAAAGPNDVWAAVGAVQRNPGPGASDGLILHYACS